MKVSAAGINLIKEFEGVRLKAYKCPAGVYTIGAGHTSAAGPPAVKAGMEITNAQAMKILAQDLVQFEDCIESMVKVPLSQNQFDALVSFAYNVGLEAFRKSTLLKKVNANPNDRLISNQFLRWNKSRGRVLQGLTKRRIEEARIYFAHLNG
jgi:lysozyme